MILKMKLMIVMMKKGDSNFDDDGNDTVQIVHNMLRHHIFLLLNIEETQILSKPTQDEINVSGCLYYCGTFRCLQVKGYFLEVSTIMF